MEYTLKIYICKQAVSLAGAVWVTLRAVEDGRARYTSTAMKRILFVCLGNICRSPTAEGVFAAYVAENGLADEVEIDSAGTSAWHLGERADPRMREAASGRGYRLTSRARQIEAEELADWDLVVAMDEENRDHLRSLHPDDRATILLLSDFLGSRGPRDVPDPYYGGAEGFDRVIDLVEAACPALLDRLLDE